MPLPSGTIGIPGPIIATAFADVPPTAALRDAGAISLRNGEIRRVNDAGDAWIVIPGWTVSDTEPTDPFEGMGWFDTNVDQLKIYYDGDFEPLAGGLSPDDLHNLALLQGLIDKTADLELRSEREWEAATDAALLVTSGRPTGPSLPNETYVQTFTYTSANIAERYLVLRVPHAANISHYRLIFTKLDGTEHALDGNHFSHLYTQSPYKYFGRSYTSNAVGDVLTIEAIQLEKETTAYIGNVEGAYPVPDIEKLTDDMQVRSEAPTWSAGANHVDIGTFQGVPTLATLEQHVYADQLDFVLASTENFAVIRVQSTMAIPQEVNAYRMVFTDTLDNSVEYIRGAYFRFLHHGLLAHLLRARSATIRRPASDT